MFLLKRKTQLSKCSEAPKNISKKGTSQLVQTL